MFNCPLSLMPSRGWLRVETPQPHPKPCTLNPKPSLSVSVSVLVTLSEPMCLFVWLLAFCLFISLSRPCFSLSPSSPFWRQLNVRLFVRLCVCVFVCLRWWVFLLVCLPVCAFVGLPPLFVCLCVLQRCVYTSSAVGSLVEKGDLSGGVLPSVCLSHCLFLIVCPFQSVSADPQAEQHTQKQTDKQATQTKGWREKPRKTDEQAQTEPQQDEEIWWDK